MTAPCYEVEYIYGLYRYQGATAWEHESGQLVIVGKWHALSIQNDCNHPELRKPYQRGTFKFTAGCSDPVSALTVAAATGDTQEVNDLVLRQKVDVNAKNSAGTCALIEAAKAGQLGVVQFLLVIKGLNVNAQDPLGWTALSWSVKNQHLEVCEHLLEVMFPQRFHAPMNVGKGSQALLQQCVWNVSHRQKKARWGAILQQIRELRDKQEFCTQKRAAHQAHLSDAFRGPRQGPPSDEFFFQSARAALFDGGWY